MTRDASGRIARVRCVLSRHKAANWVAPGRGQKSTRLGANGIVRWRGMVSHFNRQTPLDSWLYDVIGGLILFVTAVIIDLTVRRCRTEPQLGRL